MQAAVVRVYVDDGVYSGCSTFIDVPVLPDTTAADVLRCCVMPGEDEGSCRLGFCSPDDTVIEPGSKLLGILQKQLQQQKPFSTSGKASAAVRPGGSEFSSSGLKLLRVTRSGKPGGSASTCESKDKRSDSSDVLSSVAPTTDVVKPKRDLSKGWSFAEIQQLAVQQRQQMTANQRMLTDRERQLRDLEAIDVERAQQSAADSERLRQLQAYAAKKEALLQRVRAAVAADADAATKQKHANSELSAELEAARAEFQRKQSLLAAAVCKVADLTKQLEQLRTEVKVNATDRSSSVSHSSYKNDRIKALQKEYEGVKELRAKRARVRAQLQENLSSRHRDAAALDGRLVELQQDAWQRHQAALDRRQQQPTHQRPSSSSPAGPLVPNGAATAAPSASRPASNIAAVEPFIHNPSPVALGVRSYDLPGASLAKQKQESNAVDRVSSFDTSKGSSQDSTTFAASRPGLGVQPTVVNSRKATASGGQRGSPADLHAGTAAASTACAAAGSTATPAAGRQQLLGPEEYSAEGSRLRHDQPLGVQSAVPATAERSDVRQQVSSSAVAVSKAGDFVSPNAAKGDGSGDVVRTSTVVGRNDSSFGSSLVALTPPAERSSAGGSVSTTGMTSSLSSGLGAVAGSPQQTVALSLATNDSFGWRPWSPPEAAGGPSSKPHSASAVVGAQPSSVDVRLPNSSIGIAVATPSSAAVRPITALHSMLPRPWLGASATSSTISMMPPGPPLLLPAATRLAGPTSMPVVTPASARSFGEHRPTSSATMVVRATPMDKASRHGEAPAFPLDSGAEQSQQAIAPTSVLLSSGKAQPPGSQLQPPSGASLASIGSHAVTQRNLVTSDDNTANVLLPSAPHGNAGSEADVVAAASRVDRRAAGPLEATAAAGGSATSLMPSLQQPAGIASTQKLAGVAVPAASWPVVQQLSRDATSKESAVVVAVTATAGSAMSPGGSKDFVDSTTPAISMPGALASIAGSEGAAVAAGSTTAAAFGGTRSKADEAVATVAVSSLVATADRRAAGPPGLAASTGCAATSLLLSLRQPAVVAAMPKQAGDAAPAASWPAVQQLFGDETTQGLPVITASTSVPGSVTLPSQLSPVAPTDFFRAETSAVAISDTVVRRTGSEDAEAAADMVSARDQPRLAEVDSSGAEADATNSSAESDVRQRTSRPSTADCSSGVAGTVPYSSSAASAVPTVHGGTAVPSLSVANACQRRVTFHPKILLLDAALQGELHVVQAVTKKVSVNAPNEDGVTALHNAIIMGNMAIVEFLVERGCDVNAQDIDGWMPLHCAASCNNLAVAKYLVEHGACVFAATLSDNQTAAQKCEKNEEGYEGCREYLERVEAELGEANDGLVYALYDYERESDDELSLRTGQRLTVLRRGDDRETEWWWARYDDEDGGDEGYVARNLLGMCKRLPPHMLSESDIGKSNSQD